MTSETPAVVRLHLRSTLPHVDWVAIEDYCLAPGTGWAGVGWGLWGEERFDGIAWDVYVLTKAEPAESVADSVRRLHELPEGTLVWTRRRDSTYWLGEITGPWLYVDTPRTRELDLFNVRRCTWWEIGTEDAVPGKIVNNFRASKTLNPVRDGTAVRYSERLRRRNLSLRPENDPATPAEVVESLLGPADLEDLVAVYLQDRFDLVLVSRGRSTPGYEYVLRSRSSGRRAVATVKSGGSRPELDRLPHDGQTDLWAYAVDGPPDGNQDPDVRWITTDELAQFIHERSSILPENVARWLDA